MRQLDFQLRDAESSVLPNVNALAGTRQETLPVYKTLSHFLEHLEAKLITGSGLALSMGSEFIDNRHFDGPAEAGSERRKQDCELKAFAGDLRIQIRLDSS